MVGREEVKWRGLPPPERLQSPGSSCRCSWADGYRFPVMAMATRVLLPHCPSRTPASPLEKSTAAATRSLHCLPHRFFSPFTRKYQRTGSGALSAAVMSSAVLVTGAGGRTGRLLYISGCFSPAVLVLLVDSIRRASRESFMANSLVPCFNFVIPSFNACKTHLGA